MREASWVIEESADGPYDLKIDVSISCLLSSGLVSVEHFKKGDKHEG